MKSRFVTRSEGRKLDFVERPVKPVDTGRAQPETPETCGAWRWPRAAGNLGPRALLTRFRLTDA